MSVREFVCVYVMNRRQIELNGIESSNDAHAWHTTSSQLHNNNRTVRSNADIVPCWPFENH